MAESNYHVGDYALKSTGNMSVCSDSGIAAVEAIGEEGGVVVTGTQSVGIFSGDAIAVLENNEPDAGKVGISVGETGIVSLQAGAPVGGVVIRLQGPELLEMTVGAPGVGASITMTPESITFKVAETSLTLTAEGIIEDVGEVTRGVTVEGHNFTAAETEMNIGPQGFTLEGPSLENEIEGGTVVNETLGEVSTDAAKSIEASITTMM